MVHQRQNNFIFQLCEDWKYFELPMPLKKPVTAFAVTHSDNYILSKIQNKIKL